MTLLGNGLMGRGVVDRKALILGYDPLTLWPFDETSGDVFTNYGSLGAAANAANFGAQLAAGTHPSGTPCPLLDGTTDYIDLFSAALALQFNADNAASYLISWLPTDGTIYSDGLSHFFGFGTSTLARFFGRVVGSLLDFETGASGFLGHAYSSVQWTNILLRWNGDDALTQLHVNGAVVDTSAFSSWAAPLLVSLILGKHATAANGYFPGYMAYVACWDQSLDDATGNALTAL